MINKHSEFQTKERHDIFDNILLKQKEKKVLYLLLVTLVIVLGYEYNEQILNKLLPEYEVAIPAKSRMFILNSDKLEKFATEITAFTSDLPQFHSSFNAILKDIDSVKVKIKESVKRPEILKLQHKIVSDLWVMLNSPYLEESKKLIVIKKSVTKLMKKMKLSTQYNLEITPILFKKDISKTLTKPSRSIFEFSDTSKSHNEIDHEAYWNDVDDENIGER